MDKSGTQRPSHALCPEPRAMRPVPCAKWDEGREVGTGDELSMPHALRSEPRALRPCSMPHALCLVASIHFANQPIVYFSILVAKHSATGPEICALSPPDEVVGIPPQKSAGQAASLHVPRALCPEP